MDSLKCICVLSVNGGFSKWHIKLIEVFRCFQFFLISGMTCFIFERLAWFALGVLVFCWSIIYQSELKKCSQSEGHCGPKLENTEDHKKEFMKY